MDARLLEAKGDEVHVYERLTSSEQKAIDIELARATDKTHQSVRYFLENYFVINTKGEDWEEQRLQTVYPFTETQEILWAEFEDVWSKGMPAWFLLLKARQIRWSTLVQGAIFQRTTTRKNTNSLVIGDELKRSNQIFNMSNLAYNKMPWWMRPEKQLDNRGEGIIKFDRKDKDEALRNPGLNSTFFVDAANKPTGSSRGFTLHNVHATEFGLWQHPKIWTSDILPAVPKKNPMVICIAEGTAKGSGENYSFLRMWNTAMQGRGLFRPVFAAWWKEKTYCKPFPSTLEEEQFAFTREEHELIDKVRDEFGYTITKEQMNWRREQADQFSATENDPEMVEQEYPSYAKSAFRSGGITCFPKRKMSQIEVRDVRLPIWAGDLEHIKENDKDKPYLIRYFSKPSVRRELTQTENNNINAAPLWIWEWPSSKEMYYLASDPAGGIQGLDFSTIQIFSVPRRNGEKIRQVAEYRGYADARELAKMVCTLGYMYNTCEVAPECNHMTEHIGNILHVHKYPRIYRWRRQDKTKNRFTLFWGWDTGTQKHREDLIERFRAYMKDDSLEIKSARLLAECQSFIQADDSDRFEASAGEHDDLLFAAMIAVYCLKELDPKLFEISSNDQLPEPGKGAHNTDHSIFDEQEDGAAQFNML